MEIKLAGTKFLHLVSNTIQGLFVEELKAPDQQAINIALQK